MCRSCGATRSKRRRSPMFATALPRSSPRFDQNLTTANKVLALCPARSAESIAACRSLSRATCDVRTAASSRRERLRAACAREDGRLEIGPRPGVAHLIVSRAQLRRALLALQAICSEAERRGYAVRAVEHQSYWHKAGIGVAIREQLYALEILEQTDRVPLSEAELAAWKQQESGRFRFEWERAKEPPTGRNVANGKLRVSLPSSRRGARSSFSEGRSSLATRLALLFAELERRAEEDDRLDAERERQRELRRIEEEHRLERELLARIESARLERLKGEIAAWRLAQEVREYVAVLRLRSESAEEEDWERLTRWCEWAEAWSRRADPTVNISRVAGLDDERDRFAYAPTRSAFA
jgi:hypothetical protein